MIQGGLGVAAGGNINPHGTSMYEPMGGSAPKYTGQGVINPLAAIASLSMMLTQEGYPTAGRRVDLAIRKVAPTMASMDAGKMGGSTSEIGDRVAAALSEVSV